MLSAMLTWGERYEASILNSLPTAPSIAQPWWSPKLRFTRQFFPSRCCRAGFPRYSATTGDRCTAPRIRVKASIAMSASLQTFSSSHSDVRQITRNLSPQFLLAAPWNSSTTPCTISAIWFTKVMMLSCSTSVAILKFLMRVAPMMHSTRVPSTIASTLALSNTFMLCAMMLAPASPNPKANKDPSLMIVFSRITVSMISPVASLALHVMMLTSFWNLFSSCFFLAFALCISSNLNSSSATFIATRGFLRNVSTFEIMFSTGCKTSLFASLEKNSEAEVSEIQITRVMRRENWLSICTNGRRSK
mmetsp:Transcript_60755/g.172693  ORF Transcript_60755/g.172693 Transcript_60755/m.172693 type:complete len:304 (+) Transcript_60755:919-1830(+)